MNETLDRFNSFPCGGLSRARSWSPRYALSELVSVVTGEELDSMHRL